MIPNPCRVRRGLEAAGFFLWFSVFGAFAAVNVSYVGLDKCHVTYSNSNPQALAIELRVQGPGGQRTLASGTTSLSGTLNDTGLPAGEHTYQIWEKNTQEVWSVVDSTSATINGARIAGALLFDETIGNNADVSGVTVPAARKLTIGKATLTNGAIVVYGTIEFDPEAVVRSLVEIRTPLTLNNVGEVNLSFVAGSEGSSIRNGRGFTAAFAHQDFSIVGAEGGAITVTANDILLNASKLGFSTTAVFSVTLNGNNATISELRGLTLDLRGVTGTINISDTTIAQSRGTSSDPNTVFRLSKVTWQGSDATFESQVEQADRCDFRAGIITRRAAFRSTDSKFFTFSCEESPDGQVKIERGLFLQNASVVGGAAEFLNCEFGGNVNLINRSRTTVRNSIFLGSLNFLNSTSPAVPPPAWYAASSPSPTVEGNAFMGELAISYGFATDPLPSPRIAIGANYYGDSAGYREGYPSGSFLGYGGGHIGGWIYQAEAFAIATPLTSTSLRRTDTRVFPKFWCEGIIVGQNTIPHRALWTPAPIMQGRETLVSVDLVTSDSEVRNVRVFAEFEGQTINAAFTGPLHRDRSAYKKLNILNGMGGTFDIVLPPASSTSAEFTVYLDASGVGGFDPDVTPTDPILLRSGRVTCNLSPPTRNMSFVIFPIQLKGWFFDSAVPDPSGVEKVLKETLPCMVPLPANRVKVATTQPFQMGCHSDWISAIPMLQVLATELSIGLKSFNYFIAGSQTVDFVVAVLPAGSMHMFFGWGPAEGANLALRRDVLFVDESTPSAVIHELGHAIGLYTDKEQYDLYKPSGLKLEGVTAFVTENHSVPMFSGLNRAMHFPAEWYSWYFDTDWFDVMGNVNLTVWPVPSTLEAFSAWIQSNLGAAGKKSSFAPRIAAAQAEPPPGHRRILIWANTASFDGTVLEEFVPGTVSAFDVTGLNFGPIAPPASGIGYHLKGYNAASSLVVNTALYIPLANGGEWLGTFDITQSVVRYTVSRDSDAREYLNVVSGGGISNRLLRPLAPTSIQESVTIAWTATTRVAGASTNLRHLLLFSTNNGASWLPPGLPLKGTQVVWSTAFITATSTPLTIRLISSEGLTNVSCIVTGLIVQNRRPVVTITSPSDGQISLTGTLWQLTAEVRSYAGAVSDPGIWRSSLAGVLGTGRSLINVSLPQGTNLLTYVVADQTGLATTGRCTVYVRPAVTNLDLGLDEDAFRLRSEATDPLGQLPRLINPGRTNYCSLFVRNQGVETSARLSLYVQPPGGAETLVTQGVVQLPPFGVGGVSGFFVPSALGEYRFRGVLDEVTPTDPNPVNNMRTWTYSSRYPVISPHTNYLLMIFGLPPGYVPWPGEVYDLSARLTIHNRGCLDLVQGTPTITGPDAAEFEIARYSWPNTIPPGGSTDLWINAHLSGLGLHRATLELPSNDPSRPTLRVSLLGLLSNTNDVDTDGDGILDIIENAIGTNPNLRDTDGDGLDDPLEDKNLSGTLDEFETGPLVADTDGDGVRDGDEDANRNGRWDYGESSPRQSDTDGDGMSDGDEAIAGTHPFLASEYFRCIAARVASNWPSLRWVAREGRTYQVLRSITPSVWTAAPSNNAPNQRNPFRATEDGEMEYQDPAPPTNRMRWYRIDVRL